MTNIQQNLEALHQQIQTYALRYNRDPATIRLVAASKSQSIDAIQAAFSAGQKTFGENYLQEAVEKITVLNNEKIEWHFIGPIQSNKTKSIATYFDWAHCVNSLKIAARLNEQRPAHLPPLNICIQVNISEETSKAGIHPNELLELATSLSTYSHLKLRGLMTIPAIQENVLDQRAEFRKLFLLNQILSENGLKLDTLSMGMSGDMEAAIAEGSTLLRIGTTIFGERKKI